MTQAEKVKYMEIAMNIIGLPVTEEGASVLVEVMRLIEAYKGKVSILQIIEAKKQAEYEYGKDKK